jgi:hypothetical protein
MAIFYVFLNTLEDVYSIRGTLLFQPGISTTEYDKVVQIAQ